MSSESITKDEPESPAGGGQLPSRRFARSDCRAHRRARPAGRRKSRVAGPLSARPGRIPELPQARREGTPGVQRIRQHRSRPHAAAHPRRLRAGLQERDGRQGIRQGHGADPPAPVRLPQETGPGADCSAGQPFDPHVHHAVEMVETEEAPDHTVLAEFQRGYNFKGRLLRPAMVKVAVEPNSEIKRQVKK